jgi:predicted nucleic acid-binding protein
MSTLVDANVLIDIYEPGSHWAAWSESQLQDALLRGLVVISQVVAAETAAEFTSVEKHEIALRAAFIREEDIPWEAAFLAGTVHRMYRQRGGTRERTLPDFLKGAHATVKSHVLLTRDARRYRTYFPDIEIIAPDIEE